ncbi:hypothetical protein [Thauera sinica]|uniref:Cobalt-zinc-cadmium resistance protein n=2 Tax=Thauera sinica TaxID=2665146 RepID=A0ABW1AL48_9RHOO|nr:hypothetical protein [Thauera sp. K11]ATE62078.1 hypothetical protein CCZ27_20770 [Thauera sp. K11]
MRRLAALFLLVLLPLQALWAAAAPYCQHERAPATVHFGHHAHEHEASGSGTPAMPLPGGDHGDCHACHGWCSALPVTDEAAHADPGRPMHELGRLHALPSPPPSLPERPDWLTLA